MAYLTFEEYQSYGGSLSASDFVLAEYKARKYIDYLTDSRVADMEEVPEEVKLAEMELMRVEAKYGAAAMIDSPVIASYSTDGYSESYGAAESQAAAVKAAALETIRHLLYGVENDDGVPLLYRGLDL